LIRKTQVDKKQAKYYIYGAIAGSGERFAVDNFNRFRVSPSTKRQKGVSALIPHPVNVHSKNFIATATIIQSSNGRNLYRYLKPSLNRRASANCIDTELFHLIQ